MTAINGVVCLQDSNRKPSPGSCRAGGVVHLLAANGTKIPVTLHMSTRGMSADSVDIVHVVQVWQGMAFSVLSKPVCILC